MNWRGEKSKIRGVIQSANPVLICSEVVIFENGKDLKYTRGKKQTK